MAFKGDLRNVQLADLFQTLAQNRQEGVLTVTSPAGTHRIVLSKDGVTLLDPTVLGRRRLGEILVFAELLTEEDLAAALREQARTKKFLGQVLVGTGKVPQESLDRILTIQVDEEIYELFRGQGGTFEFTDCDVPSLLRRNHHRLRPLAVEHVVFEAARRLDEWSEIERVIPSIDGLYLANCAPDSVGDDELAKKILARLDGRHTVRDVADTMLDSPFQVAKVLSRLVEEGRARAATREELHVTARELLTEGQKARAQRLLHRLAQMSPEPSALDAQLAELFKMAGDGKSAAQVRIKTAAAARAQSKPDVARQELEAALKEWPGAPAVLQPLVAVLQELGDQEAELARLRELGNILAESGATDASLASMERILELAPDDADARRIYSDLCLRAHLKEKAVEVLEKDVARLRRDGRLAELPALYKRILTIDPGRKDIKRALAAATRTKSDRLLRSAGAIVALAALLSLAGFVGWRMRTKSQGFSTVEAARVKLAAGLPEDARQLLTDLLATEPVPDVAQAVMRLLDQIDEHVADATRVHRGARDEELSRQLAAVQARVDQRQYDAALKETLALLAANEEAYLADRVRTRLQAVTQEFLSIVSRARDAVAAFQQPKRDNEVAGAWARMNAAFPPEFVAVARAVREIAAAAAKEVAAEPRSWMNELVAASDSYLELERRMRPELDALRRQHERLQRLQELSVQYVEAARAAEAGNVERARELLRKVLEEYGEGELSKVFQERIDRLDGAAAAVKRVDELVAAGDIEGANAAARTNAEQYRELQIPSTLQIPVLLDSLPHGASVRVDGRDAGATPCVVRVLSGRQAKVDVTIAGRTPQQASIAAEGAVRVVVELPRRAIATGRVELATVAAPAYAAGRFAIAGRDGSLQSVAPAAGGTLERAAFATGALSGSLATPIALDDGLVAALYDGRLVRLRHAGGGLTEAWSRPIDDQVEHPPLRCGDRIAVAGASGRLLLFALADGTPLADVKLSARVGAAPARVGDRLFVPLVGGKLAAISLATQKLEFERPIGHDVEHALVPHGDGLLAVTASGKLLRLGLDGTLQREIPLGDAPVDAPLAGDRFADVPLGKQVVRVDLVAATVAQRFTNLAPTATPALIGGQLWVPCDRGVVQILDPARGEIVDRAHLGGGALAGTPLECELGVALLARDGSFLLLER